MKKRMRRLLASLVLLLAVTSGAQAGFKLEPIGPELGTLGSGLSQRFCSYRPDLKADKLPEGAKDVKLGRIALDCVNPILFAAWSSTGGQTPDTLVFDLNGDKDFTNDPKHTIPATSVEKALSEEGKEIEVQLPKGPTVKIQVALTQGFALIKTDLWLKGQVDLDGKKIAAAVASTSEQGLGSDEGRLSYLFLDTNANGKFDISVTKMAEAMGKEFFYLSSGTNIQGTLYDYKFDKEKLDLQLTPYTGPQGKLAVQLDLPIQTKAWNLSGVLMEEKQGVPLMFAGADKMFPLSVKTGNYRLANGALALEMENGKNILLEFTAQDPLKIEAGATVTLPVGKPKPLEVTLTQNKNTLSVGRVFKGENGIQYGRVQTISDKPDAKELETQPNGGKVVIQDATGKQVGEGTLEYG
jgi:hypothetical protein